MNLDKIKKHIQTFFDQGTLTIVGSGLSASEGIPGMGKLSIELVEKMPDKLNKIQAEKWNLIALDLQNDYDLEQALQRNEVCEVIENNIINITYNLIAQSNNDVFDSLVMENRNLKFSKYLSRFNLDVSNYVVITTNYDLLIEYACEQIEHPYIDSFYGKIVGKYSPEESLREMVKGVKKSRIPRNRFENHIKIYKPHGSINWKLINNQVYKIQNYHRGNPCIITPGINKYEKGYEIPFDYHIGKMGEEIDKSNRIVFIGYGFNDNHLETHLNNHNNVNKPKLILTMSLTENALKTIDKNVMAIECLDKDNYKGTTVYWNSKVYKYENLNLWDLGELIKEIF